jgi:protein TonB
MNPIRIALGILLAALIAGPAPARPQDQNSPPAVPSAAPSASSVPHPFRIRVGANVAASSLVHVVQPEYHSDSKIRATVVLHAVIDFDGTVKNLEFVSGPPLLTNAVMDAVKQWRYRPTLVNGQRVQVDTTINLVIATDKHGKLKPQP